MLRDPEAIEDERRPRLVTGGPGGSSTAAIADSVDVDPVAVTAELLARLRAGDDLVDGVRWLCIVRSDRRPATAEQLRQAIEAVAAQDGVDVDQVRTGIARALAAEGRNLEAWEASLRGARPLGRSTRTDQAAAAGSQRPGRQLILLEPAPDDEAEPGAPHPPSDCARQRRQQFARPSISVAAACSGGCPAPTDGAGLFPHQRRGGGPSRRARPTE